MKRNRHQLITGALVLSALAALGGCAGTAKTTMPTAQSAEVRKESAPPVLSGKITETMEAGGYTYICLEKDGKQTWAAVPRMPVKVGDEIALQPGSEMGPFTSKTLNRTFDKIIFSGGPVAKPASNQATLPPGHPGIPAAKDGVQPVVNNTATTTAKEVLSDKPIYAGKVVETMNAGGYTYICLEKDGKRSWAAIPTTEVKVGDVVEIRPGTEMGRFTSKTLNRTFDNIVFSAGLVKK